MSQTRAMTVEAEARPRRKLRDRAEAEPTITRPSRGRGTWFKTEAPGCRGRAETEQAPRWWRNRAITMHRPFDTCWLRNWHRRWLVVWSCQDRLLQCCAPRRSQLQHQEVAASTEQRSSDRSRSTKTIPRLPVAEDVTLAARSAEDRLQSGSADIQSSQHLDAVVPATPNPGSRTRPQPAIDHYGAVSAFHDDDIILRNALFDVLRQLSGTHYRKQFSIVTLLQFLSLG